MLPKHERLKSNRRFQKVYSNGRSFPEACVVLHVLKEPEEPSELQIGFSVSKKLGNAVVRNRVKRRLRAAVYPYLNTLPRGYLLVFVARRKAAEAQFCDLERSVKKVLHSARLLKEPKEPKELKELAELAEKARPQDPTS